MHACDLSATLQRGKDDQGNITSPKLTKIHACLAYGMISDVVLEFIFQFSNMFAHPFIKSN